VKVTPPPGFMGGVVPLSEHEQRQLEQIEQALYREDRRLARLVRSSDPRVHYKRRGAEALFGLALGAAMIAAGIVLPVIGLFVPGVGGANAGPPRRRGGRRPPAGGGGPPPLPAGPPGAGPGARPARAARSA